MRPTITLRTKRTIQIAIALTILTAVSGALALSAAAAAPAASTARLHATVTPRVARLGQEVTVRGTAPASAVGHRAVLESSSRLQSGWRALQASSIAVGGRFGFRVRLRHSGYLRVIDSGAVASTGVIQANRAQIPDGSASVAQRVAVAARFALAQTHLDALAGHSVSLRGTLRPAQAGRLVRVQARQGHAWKTLGIARTGVAGRFRARLSSVTATEHRLRVRFGGDNVNAAVTGGAGLLTVFEADTSSWYNDGGSTGCGFHATYGVANRTLPCGSRVHIRYGHRSVTATVDDRGPYVGGRNWDLNQNTAAALGFAGVGTIWIAR